MTRTRLLMLALVALGLLAAAAPGPAGARSRVLKVALPSPGDITLMHLNFKRGVARSRRAPRFQRLSATDRRLLRRNNVAVVGSSVRVSRTRVVGTVVLLRRKKGGRRASTGRARSLRVVVDRPVASTVTQRNVLRRRAPKRAGAAGEVADAATCTGETGLFTLLSGDTIPQGNWSYGLYYNDWDRFEPVTAIDWNRLSASLGYGLYCDSYDPDLSRLLGSIGSEFPVNCLFTSTFIGSATDSEGNVLTQPTFSFEFRCDGEVEEAILVLELPHRVVRCQDSAGHSCQIHTTRNPGDTASFPFPVQANESRSFSVSADPPLRQGVQIDLVIDLFGDGQIRDQQVM